jgi:hypothetical protein
MERNTERDATPVCTHARDLSVIFNNQITVISVFCFRETEAVSLRKRSCCWMDQQVNLNDGQAVLVGLITFHSEVDIP